VVSFTPLPLYPRYPFYRRLGGPQSRSERYGEVKIFTLPGLELPPPPDCPARRQSLYQLTNPGSLRIGIKTLGKTFVIKPGIVIIRVIIIIIIIAIQF
jgi:hypothetical protein